MKRIVEVQEEPGDGLWDYVEVLYRYENGKIGRAAVTKDGLAVQRLVEALVDSGSDEKKLQELVEAVQEESWRERDRNGPEDLA